MPRLRRSSRCGGRRLRRVAACCALLLGCGGDDALPDDGGSPASDLDAGLQAPPYGTAIASDASVVDLVPGALRWVGRVDLSDPNAPRFSWDGAGFVATFTGPDIALTLRTTDTDTVFFQPVVDGVPSARIEVPFGADRTVTVAQGLSDGEHELELYRDTEGDLGVSSLLAIARGTLVGAKRSQGRSIEVVGDSISAGYGALGSEALGASPPVQCEGDPSNSSWYATYAARAGHALDAEVSTIAHSGWGMVRDGAGGLVQVLPAIYDRLLGSLPTPAYDFAREPDAVVINLGTNDWTTGDPGKSFEKAYQAFLTHVRSVYPHAWFVLAIGSMLDEEQRTQVLARLDSVVAARKAKGDVHVSSLDLGTQDAALTGCLAHPDVAEHLRMAAILQRELSARLGW